ncbi:uncharacterized protein [Aegilops tauschii subsp. strangulata]|uniref:uncharacterized protein n=1 Tax=Aegilops tauschii subsp. strangulata TaxID=200361 RepID=UPI003CC8B803
MNTSRHVWYLDTGASNHMTGDKDQFSELSVSVGGTVQFGDGRTVDIAGRGTVLFELKNGGHKVLTDVYYILKLKSSIISLGQLEERGCKIVLEDGFLWGYDRQMMLIMKVQRSPNRLYVLNLDRVDLVCLLSSMDDSAWKWHARYGHLNFQALRQLGQKEMVILISRRSLRDGAMLRTEARQETRQLLPLSLTHTRERNPAADAPEGTYGTPGSTARTGGVVPPGAPKHATPARGSRGPALASPGAKSLSAGGVSSRQQSSPLAAAPAHEGHVREGHVHEHGTPVLTGSSDSDGATSSSEEQESTEIGGLATPASTSSSPTAPEETQRPPMPFRLRPVVDLYPKEVLPKVNPVKIKRKGRWCLLSVEEPTKFEDANMEECWRRAMDEELGSIQDYKTWELVDPPNDHKIIGLKWVYKVKKDAEGNLVKHKARLVAKGYVQEQGVDFEEVFAPITRMESHAMYKRGKGKDRLLVGIYVDDLLITRADEEEIARFKLQMKEPFKMSDLGLLTYYVGIEVDQKPEGITLCQKAYAKKILESCSTEDCNPSHVPMEP